MGTDKREGKSYLKKWIICMAVTAAALSLLVRAEGIAREDETHIKKVFCMGDSITYGSGPLPEEELGEASYPARLQQFLGERYEVINYGLGGRTLLDIPDKCYRNTGYIDAVKTQEPDILIVMLGTNDSKAGHWDAAAYKRDYVNLVRELAQIPSEPEIYIMAPPKAFPRKDGEIIYGIDDHVIRDEIGMIVREVADETEAYIIDLYTVTEEHPEYYVDGVHFNSIGYEALARAVCEEIQR